MANVSCLKQYTSTSVLPMHTPYVSINPCHTACRQHADRSHMVLAFYFKVTSVCVKVILVKVVRFNRGSSDLKHLEHSL